jgi:hypothetical protein
MYEDGQLCDMGRFSEPADDPTGQSAGVRKQLGLSQPPQEFKALKSIGGFEI